VATPMSNYENAPHCYFSVPVERRLIIEVTRKCNLHCCHCCSRSGPEGKDISLQKLKRVVEKISPKEIYISGGEPFLYPQITEFVKWLKRRNIYISIATNGTLVDKLEEVLPFVDKIQVSIDGLREDHDELRGKGAFDTVVNCFLKKFDELRNTQTLRISCTLWKNETLEEGYIKSYLDFLGNNIKPDEIVFNILLPVGRGSYLGKTIFLRELKIKSMVKKVAGKNNYKMKIIIHRDKPFDEKFQCPGGNKIFFYGERGYSPCSWIYKLMPEFTSEDLKKSIEAFTLFLRTRERLGEFGCPAAAILYSNSPFRRDKLWKNSS
jgi:MoaA/NifB/PqqE/SkfB family radical SAM enzyme